MGKQVQQLVDGVDNAGVEVDEEGQVGAAHGSPGGDGYYIYEALMNHGDGKDEDGFYVAG